MIVSDGQAVQILLEGGVVAVPTETVWGLACLPTEAAKKRLCALKKRPLDQPIALAAARLSDLRAEVEIPLELQETLQSWLPGPVSVVLNARDELADLLAPGTKSLSIRIPDHPVAQQLLRITGPLALTSANLHGKPEPRTYEEIWKQVGQVPTLVGGPDPSMQASTVVDARQSPMKVLRQGAFQVDLGVDPSSSSA